MRNPKLIQLLLFLLISVSTSFAFSDEAYVKIASPADGAKLDAMAQNKVVYDVSPGPKGDHSHIYVDKKEAAVLRKLKGEYLLETLAMGSHDICIKVVNKGHTPIGVEKCIKVKVE